MMKRVGIFIFYDKDGIVDRYVEYLLESMQTIIKKLIIVINGKIREDNLCKLKRYSNDIFIRENKGYDGTAYKETLLYYLKNENWSDVDELILFNDTFYGPFFSLENIFASFESKCVDFWGFSKWISGKSTFLNNDELPEHLQAYFLVIKNRMLCDNAFLEFWRNMEKISVYTDAIRYFEISFTTFFKNKGFKYGSWIDFYGNNKYLLPGSVIYINHPYELVSECNFPFIKHKAINIINFSNILKSFLYIKKIYNYDFEIIWEHVMRKDLNDLVYPYSFHQIDDFYNNHKRTYVFGYGKRGRNLESYFIFKGWKIEAFLVSETEKEENVKKLTDVMLEKSDGIIVALSEKPFAEVENYLKNMYEPSQLLLPKFKMEK